MNISLKIFKKVRGKQRYQKTLFAIPYLFTFGNAAFGFLSVISALEGDTKLSALFILCAALMDGFDGRLARYFRVTSNLGMELDSLCDAVSFCLAPMILLYSSYEHAHYFFIAALSIALCAGLFRLARFNIISPDNKEDFFKGLPTTIVAMFIASLVYYRDSISQNFFSFLLDERWLAGVVLFLAFLMVSAIPFPSFKKRTVYAIVFRLLMGLTALLFVASFFYDIPVFFIITLVYIVSGLVLAGIAYAKRVLA
jgi:CDP-diacylglycerol--serine O-phosphatidyltransferase